MFVTVATILLASTQTTSFSEPKKHNLADMRAKGRSTTGDRHSSITHPESITRGEKHYNAHLTDADIRAIRRLSASGMNQRDIAARFGVTRSNVSVIVTKKRWKHVKEEEVEACSPSP